MADLLVRSSLMTHRKTISLARILDSERYTAAGVVIALWLWALDHARDGVLGSDFPSYAADITGYEGDGASLVDSLQIAGWIASVDRDSDREEVGFTYILSGWDDKDGPLSHFTGTGE